jgi:uncharacterized protein (DUF302 family)
MKNIRISSLIIVLALSFISQANLASEAFINAGCEIPFPEAMAGIQNIIKKQGYTVSRVQYVDKGLTERGYKTDSYRVIFFGKNENIQLVRERYPALLPFIPLSIVVIENGQTTDISTLYPEMLSEIYKTDEIKELVKLWSDDVTQIFEEFQLCQS